jgi:hypothetical protein
LSPAGRCGWFLTRALQARDRQKPSLRADVADALLILLLAWAHVFWMVAAGVTTALLELEAPSWKRMLRRGLLFVPVVIPSVVWALRLAHERAAAGFDLSAHWLQRWLPLGGLHGAIEPAIEGCVAVYIVLTLFRASPPRLYAID